MRADIVISPDGPERWTVTIGWGGGDPLTRNLPRLPDRPWLTPPAGDATDVVAAAARIHEIGEVEPGDGERFGRFLFDALLGDAWPALAAAAGDGVIELALRADAQLHGLAWELLHDGDAFLAIRRDPPVTITRVVNSAAAPRTIARPPRVLFAIGSSLHDPAIRPGADFIGLLRRLEADGGAINARVQEAADLTTLQRAAARFKPDVVHIVAHGAEAGAAEPAILVPDGPGSQATREATADQLLAALRHENGLPAIVVLAACNTATTVGGPTASSLAAALVAGGVPIVVAMAGNVADDACRFFTRRFGQVLTESHPLVAAVAQGRRAAFFEGPPPDASIDWALPTLFISEAVAHDHQPVAPADGLDLGQLARGLKLQGEPVFCGRREFVDAYDEMMGGASLRVLVIESADTEGVGRRRLLKELGAIALRDGHAPLLLMPPDTAAPRTLRAFGAALAERIADLRTRLKLPDDGGGMLLKALAGPVALPDDPRDRSLELSRRLAAQRQDPAPLEAEPLRTAIGWDLERLALDLRDSTLPTRTPASRPVVLLSGVESWADALIALLEDLLDQDGLGTEAEPVPVVVACRASGSTLGVLTPVRERYRGLDPWIRVMELGPFTEREDRIAYQWVLLNPRRSLRVQYADKAYVVREPDGRWLGALRDITLSLPSGMDKREFYAVAHLLAGFQELEIKEDDEQRLRLYLEQVR